MKTRILSRLSVLAIALTGLCLSGCAPMVYDSNPHFSHHRLPPRQDPYYRPVVVKPGTYPGYRPSSLPPTAPGANTKPAQQPNNNPGNSQTGRPGTGNRR